MSKNYRLKYKKLPTQAKVFDDVHTKTIIQSMGLGGGKTYNLCMKALQLSQLNKNIAGGFLGPSFPEMKKDVIPTFEDILEKHNIPYRYHKTEKWFLFPWSKAPLYLFSAEKQIAGPNLGYCLINEFSLMPFVRISEMLRRVRVKAAPFKQRILAGTPEDVHGWLEEFIESQEKRGNFKIHFGDTDENTFIDDDYGEDLASLLDPQALEVFKKGLIARLGGDYFYYSWTKNNISDHVTYVQGDHIYVGLDFNVGNMTASFSHKQTNRQLFFDELHLKGDSNTEVMGKRIREMYPQHDMTIICDASGKNRSTAAREKMLSDVAILKHLNFKVKFKNQNPRLRNRQLLMNGMMYHNRLLVHPKCKQLIRDFKGTRQKMDFTKDEGSDKSFSHFSDGADYVCDMNHELILGKKRPPIRLS